ncbi:MATE family efflux transporter [Corynebacterium diphtheriae]|uniref:MATE family efflux transporter n=1 Tax=Corynebacterium diphtheriae TaxID=1717 RepID=UPI0024BC2860|nr:MATE family efflux transporter [Corynebacterium diphtheriae]
MNTSLNDTADRSAHITAVTVLALALPSLGVLAATPLYLLLDTAVVGGLGTVALAALGAGTVIYSQVTTQLTFLSYGTTARSARLYGAGKQGEAVYEGVQATWIALLVGAVLATILFFGAPTFAWWLTGNREVANNAGQWLRITAFGVPLILAIMAGNGWLRGIQSTRAPLVFTLAGVILGACAVPFFVHWWGLVGSAWANLMGTSITAVLFVGCLARYHRGSWRPQWRIMKTQLVLGRDLILRSFSFQVSFLSAAAVAGRFGAESLAAHQVLMQLWGFLTLVLDSLAIAGQTLTGAALGAGSAAVARAVGEKSIRYSTFFGVVLAAVFAVGWSVIPQVFTRDTNVLNVMAGPWWQLVALIALGGVVFALDGILLGASDAAFLRTVSIASVVCGFLPGVWLALIFDAGLVGVWWGLIAFLCIRLGTCWWRFRSMKWARVS